MDYEKKYKEALEIAKRCYKDLNNLDGVVATMSKDFFEEVFPELKESEDEKIRKALIKVFSNREKYLIDQSFGDITVSEALVWLEKQSKKDIQVILPTFTFDDILALQCCMKTVEKVQKDEELYNQLKSLHDRLHDAYWLEKQGEKESDPRYENLEKILAADDISQMSMNDEMVQEAKEMAVNALSGMCIGRLLGLEKQYVQKPIISNNALREGIAHFGITQYQIDNWLKKYVDVEKQGEQILANSAKTCKDRYSPKFRVGDTIKCKYDDRQFTIKSVDFNKETYTYTQEGCGNDIDYADEEFELVEQKPSDKAQPKFKVGDWVIRSAEGFKHNTYLVTEVKDYYICEDLKGRRVTFTFNDVHKNFKLWTIQDAKDGDVLVAEIDEEPNDFIYIFKEYNQNLGFWSHCYLDAYTNKFHEGIYHNNLNVGVPATKEQRDMFFQKMHEAGYEWDFEVKELNKIEKKPACSEEEKQLLLKDLCARLPYKVRCKCVSGLGGGETEKGVLKYVGNCYGVISNYYEGVPLHSGFVNNVFYPIENIKPYLRPMASMTDEEFQKLRNICPHSIINKTNVTEWFVGINGSDYGRISRVDEISKFIDWLNAHYFDFRGLIEKGLALEAPEGMYN